MNAGHGTARRAAILGMTLASALVATVPLAQGQDMDLPVPLQATLFARVMSFDRAIDARGDAPLAIAIVYQGGFGRSAAAMEEICRALDATLMNGRKFRIIRVDLDRVSLDSMVVAEAPRVLYVAPLRGVDVAAIARVSQHHDIGTYTGVPAYVRRGIGVSARIQGDRPRLLVNLHAARAEGSSFDSSLLQLAEILR